jgi:general nucleoside transport system ATP-binding protein
MSVLEVRDVTKQFPGVLANDHINLKLEKGEILALLGENGAGKTTLMNIIYGLYRPDAGQLLLNDKDVTLQSPHDAIQLGIGMVHQHFMLIPVFTVAENIMLGAETSRAGQLDRRTVGKQVRALSHQYGLDLDPEVLVGDLPVGLQQRVEIVKALYRHAEVLILDEPTAVLTPQESDDLFRIMRELTKRGVSIIFITHKLREVLAAASRIVVMRAGRVVGVANPNQANEAQLAAMMVGRDVTLKVDRGQAQPGAEILAVSQLEAADDSGHLRVRGASFAVHAGEVFGIAGVQGNGQTELAEVLTGLRSARGGMVELCGKNITRSTPRQITELGAAHIPEDRHRHGLVLPYPLTHNRVLNVYYQPPFAHGIELDLGAIERDTAARVKEFDVRTPSVQVAASTLSGGNQQKLIVAREFSRPIKFLLANQPTRGLDVGSIEYIHRRLIEKRDAGCAVLLISSELDEILALSDRIGVMYNGRIVAVLRNAWSRAEYGIDGGKLVGRVDTVTVSKEHLGLLMTGMDPAQIGQAMGGGVPPVI